MNENNNKLKFISSFENTKIKEKITSSENTPKEILPNKHKSKNVSDRLSEPLKDSLSLENFIKDQTNLHELLDLTIEGKFIIDLDGQCIYLNKAFLELLKYPNEEDLLGKDIHDYNSIQSQ